MAQGEDCEGPDLIYLPELPFDVEKFVEKVKELLTKKQSVVVAVSEGIRLEDGRYVCELTDGVDYVDAFGLAEVYGLAAEDESKYFRGLQLIRNAGWEGSCGSGTRF